MRYAGGHILNALTSNWFDFPTSRETREAGIISGAGWIARRQTQAAGAVRLPEPAELVQAWGNRAHRPDGTRMGLIWWDHPMTSAK